MLLMICHRPLWINRLVTMVHGRWRKLAGCNPRRKISSGAIAVAINNKKFNAIRTHIGVSLKLWYLLYAITLFTEGFPLAKARLSPASCCISPGIIAQSEVMIPSSVLSVGQSLLIVLPYLMSFVMLTVVCFAI